MNTLVIRTLASETSTRGKLSTIGLATLAVVAVLVLAPIGGVVSPELTGSVLYPDSEYPVLRTYDDEGTNTITFEVVAPGETSATLVLKTDRTVISELSSVGAEDSYSYPPGSGVGGEITVYVELDSGERRALYTLQYGDYGF